MTKSLANKLRLKERLFTLNMSEGTPIQTHLNEYNSILLDLENLAVTIDDEDKAVIIITSLPLSFKHFKEIIPLPPSNHKKKCLEISNLPSKHATN